MKSILRHISLLLFSGLILPVCNSSSAELLIPVIPYKAERPIQAQPRDLNDADHSCYGDLTELAFPVLKSFNKM